MSLEFQNEIDIVSELQDGRVCLVLTDAGITTDPSQRVAALSVKLKTYLNYATSQQFETTCPGKTWRDVFIQILSKNPPPPEFDGMYRIRSMNTEPVVEIPVEWTVFDPEAQPRAPVSPDPSDDAEWGDPAEKHALMLYSAIMLHDVASVAQSLAEGADPLRPVHEGHSSLMVAAMSGHVGILKQVIDAVPDFTPRLMRQAWLLAMAESHADSARLVEQRGYRPTLVDRLAWRLVRARLRQQEKLRRLTHPHTPT